MLNSRNGTSLCYRLPYATQAYPHSTVHPGHQILPSYIYTFINLHPTIIHHRHKNYAAAGTPTQHAMHNRLRWKPGHITNQCRFRYCCLWKKLWYISKREMFRRNAAHSRGQSRVPASRHSVAQRAHYECRYMTQDTEYRAAPNDSSVATS